MIKNIVIVLCSLLTCSAGFAQKPSDTPSSQMEKLDRGLIVVPMSNKHYISWRMFGTDDKGTTFEVLKNGVTLKKDIYGATFIDHDSRSVLNGSRMCKELSANALEQFFNSPHDHTQTQQGQTAGQTSGGSPFTGADQWQSQSTPVSDYDHSHSDFDGFGLFTTDNPAVDPAEEEFRRRMQRKKKKRRGPKL